MDANNEGKTITVPEVVGGGDWTTCNDPLQQANPTGDLTLDQSLIASDGEHRCWWSSQTTYGEEGWHGWAIVCYDPSNDSFMAKALHRREGDFPKSVDDERLKVKDEHDMEDVFAYDDCFMTWADVFELLQDGNPIPLELKGFWPKISGAAKFVVINS